MKLQSPSATLGVIVGNRGFFPAELARDGRAAMLAQLEAWNIRPICLTPEETRHGAVESYQEAKQCAALFRRHRDELDGVLVTLPNFGDERAIAAALRLSELNLPVLVHAFPDAAGQMRMGQRRDSVCGKMSACNNLRQFGIKYSLTREHVSAVDSAALRRDLADFAAVCRIVRGLRHSRVGAIGARPAAFNTVRYSEKLLELAGISVEVIDLSEILGRIGRLADDAAAVSDKLAAIQHYVPTGSVPRAALLKMAKLGVVIEQWMAAHELTGASIQCWTALEEFFGVVPCTIMSMMSQGLVPSACEVDMVGMLAMRALQLASGSASAIVDWNNNFGDDPDKAVIFHCSNLPKDFFAAADWKMDFQEIIAGSVGQANTYGTVTGKITPGPLTLLRISSDDIQGRLRAYVTEGESTADALASFGGYGVVKVPRLQALLAYACREGFEHHVSVNRSHVAAPIAEALGNYLGWEVYHHA